MTVISIRADNSLLAQPGTIAVAGAGAFGRFCIEAYRKSGDLRVVAVTDPNPGALAQVNAPGARLEADWRSLLSDDYIEVLHVATPPYLRSEVVIAALQRGKSVFCEKPLARTLEEADAMIDAAVSSRVALGVNYVMRHQRAYRMLEHLAASGLFGRLRTISFQNFAQAPSPDHWFWDRSRSGGIFVEHGVHFFDAYGRLTRTPIKVWGGAPRREAVEATVEYGSGAIGHFYHEFAFPVQVERAMGVSMFEQGYVQIEGWIPTRLSGAVIGNQESFRRLGDEVGELVIAQDDNVARFQVDFPHREVNYETGIVAGMRDVVRRHRDPRHRMKVSVEDARASLALALACQEAAIRRGVVEPGQEG